MRLDYDELRKIYRLEKNSSRLADVEEDFFDSLEEFFKKQKKDYLKSLDELSGSKAKNFSNLKKIVSEIFSIREKKLLNKALIASRTGELEAEKMASQESKTLRSRSDVLNRHQSFLDQVLDVNSRPAVRVKQPSGVSLRFLQNVPAFRGADMKEYGPFEKDSVCPLPEKIASLLVSRKLAERE
jgi:DNA replication initiation complex subunit (GINS family)